MELKGDLSRPFVELRLAESPGVDATAAIEALRRAYGARGRQCVALPPEGGLSAADEELLGARESPQDLRDFLVAILSRLKPLAFICTIDWAKELEDDVRALLEQAARKVSEATSPGFHLAVVSADGRLAGHVGSLRVGDVHLVKTATRKAAKGSRHERLLAAVTVAPPKADHQDWEWDTDEIGDLIRELRQDDIDELVRRRAHFHAADRLRDVYLEMCGRFIERDRALETMIAAAVAGANMVFLGPPGTAKSLMVRTFGKFMGISSAVVEMSAAGEDEARQQLAGQRRMFEYLLTRFTNPSELFGEVDIQRMVTWGETYRNTAGMLPRARIAFLDEIFKANSAILNALLSLINEGIFYNMGCAFRAEPVFVVGASNEAPDEVELGALYDRFPLRVQCAWVRAGDQDKNLQELILTSHRSECVKANNSSGSSRVGRRASLNDVLLLQRLLPCGLFGGADAFGGVDDKVRSAFLALWRRARQDFGFSDRSAATMLRMARAVALLDDPEASVLAVDHLRPFGHIARTENEVVPLRGFVSRVMQEHKCAADVATFWD